MIGSVTESAGVPAELQAKLARLPVAHLPDATSRPTRSLPVALGDQHEVWMLQLEALGLKDLDRIYWLATV